VSCVYIMKPQAQCTELLGSPAELIMLQQLQSQSHSLFMMKSHSLVSGHTLGMRSSLFLLTTHDTSPREGSELPLASAQEQGPGKNHTFGTESAPQEGRQ
jgi:hypothetical protein